MALHQCCCHYLPSPMLSVLAMTSVQVIKGCIGINFMSVGEVGAWWGATRGGHGAQLLSQSLPWWAFVPSMLEISSTMNTQKLKLRVYVIIHLCHDWCIMCFHASKYMHVMYACDLLGYHNSNLAKIYHNQILVHWAHLIIFAKYRWTSIDFWHPYMC